MEISLKGKTALITGGTGHIGRAIAETFAACGAAIALLDKDEAQCTAACRHLTDHFGVRTLAVPCDLANDASTHTAPHIVAETLGGVDILVNNAAFVGTSKLEGWVTDFAHQTTDTWRKAVEVNLNAPFTLCRETAPYLAKSGQGCIVNVGSIYAVYGPDMGLYEGTPMGNPAAYGAAKAGLLQLTRWLATTLAPSVRVNSVCPGGVWRNQPEIFVKRYADRTPLGRMANEDDMCGTILYLVSDMSKYVTGQNIMIDGGFGVW